MTIKHGFLSLLLLLFISACTKISQTEIGTGLLPPVDGVVTKDTSISIDVKNSGSTDTVSLSLYDDHALGYVNDPLFGITNAVVNVQLLPTAFSTNFFEVGSESLTLDSVVLALDVRGVWGDTMQPMNLHVKELNNEQSFISDSTLIIYNNTSQFTTTNELTYSPAGASVYPYLLNDSFKVFQDSGSNMLRIRLTDDFGNKLLHTFSSAGVYDSTLIFKNAFKGLQISADASSANNLLRIGLASSTTSAAEPNTKLALYYKYKDTVGKIDTVVKYLTVNTTSNTSLADLGSAHSNFIEHNVATGQIARYYPSTTGTKNDDYVYIQSAPGTYATLTIDSAGLGKLPNYIIHRAEIIMEQAPDASTSLLDNFTTPYLFLLVKPADNLAFQKDTTKFVIPGFETTNTSSYDALFTSALLANYSEFGGVPLRKTNLEGATNINYYNFNVSRYIQGIVTNKNPQYTFTLYTPFKEIFQLDKGIFTYGRVASTPVNNAGIGRVKLYGGGSDTTNRHRMKLHIVYSIPH